MRLSIKKIDLRNCAYDVEVHEREGLLLVFVIALSSTWMLSFRLLVKMTTSLTFSTFFWFNFFFEINFIEIKLNLTSAIGEYIVRHSKNTHTNNISEIDVCGDWWVIKKITVIKEIYTTKESDMINI